MKSKTSFFEGIFGNWAPPSTKASFPGDYFNRTLYVKNLTRYWPLWGLASLGGALMVLALILSALRGYFNFKPLDFAQDMYQITVVAAPSVLLCYCILCAMAVWSWLYNPRSVGLYHTLPVRREGLFITSFLSGLTMTAIPFAVTGLFTVLLSLITFSFSAKAFLVTIGLIAGEGFFYFASATAVAFITGNTYALFVLYGIFHFLMPLLDTLVTVFASNLIFGLRSSSYTGVAEYLCPTIFLTDRIGVRRLYDIPFPDDGLMRDYRDHWIGVALDNGWIVAAYVLAGVALAGIAWLLYRRRRSECAGDVIAVGWLKPVFQAGVTAVCALGGGQLLYLMLMNGFDDYTPYKYALFPLILCMTFAGAIGYYAAAMFLAKSLRVFRKSDIPGIAAILACCTVLSSLLYFDAFGAETRIPDMDRVRYVHLELAGNNYFLYPGEDDELLAQVTGLHREIIAERDYIRNINNFDARLASDQHMDNWDYESLMITYQLKNGRSVYRSYPLFLTKSRLTQEGTFDYMMDRLVNSVPMRLRRLHAGDRHFLPVGGNLIVQRTGSSYDLSSRETEQLLDALARDAAEGTWGTYHWFSGSEQSYAIDLNMLFEAVDTDGNGQTNRSRDYTWIDIRPGMAHTIDALKEMGYVTDADLITHDEFDRLMDGQDPERFEKYPADEIPAEPVPAEPEPVEPVPAEPTEPTEPVNPEAADPNSYTPPAVADSSSSVEEWPSAQWDETADRNEVEQYGNAA